MNNSYLWHCRLGHIHEGRIQKLLNDGYLDPFDYESYATCESCLQGKMTNSPFSGTGERASELLELIHTDVCGPMSTHARGGYSYFNTFTDDFSRYGHVYLMKYKSEAFEKFREYKYKNVHISRLSPLFEFYKHFLHNKKLFPKIKVKSP